MADTWGVPGPTFLTLYLLAFLFLLIVGTAHRAVLFGGPRDAADRPLGPQQAAYLNGGARLALYSSLAGLRAAGAVGTDPQRRTLQQTGPLPGGVTPLDTAVYNAAGRRPKTRALADDSWVRSSLEQLRDGLETAGLAVSAGRRSAARMWGAAGLLLFAVGVARIIAGLANDKPVGFLVLAIFPVLVVALVQVARVPAATRAGRSATRRLRTDQRHLAPALAPSYATYGASGAAMGVALYGTASLWVMDPTFAAEAEIQRTAGGTGYTGSSCGAGGGDSGSSSSSSSSSCGGGGGGGGGCGG